MEAEAARLAGELRLAEAEEAAGARPSGPRSPPRWRLWTARPASYGSGGRRCSATGPSKPAAGAGDGVGAEQADVDPEQAIGRLRARREGIARAAEREQQDLDALGARVAGLEQRQASAAVRADLLVRNSEDLDAATAALDAALAATTEELALAARGAEAAQAAADEATDARHRSSARAEALERALSELQGAGGRELLRHVDGVVGSLVDLVEIDPGWEAAFEAAAGAGVAAVVVDGRRSAQAALSTLRERGVTGAVLAPRQNANGHAAVASADSSLPPGSSAQPVRRHVRARQGGAVAESVLDTLVGRSVRVDGWEEAIDLSLAREDLVVVTPEGDRFAATGWRVRSGAGVVTKAAVEEAQARAAADAAAAELAKAALTEARIASSRARDARTAAERAADRHGAAIETKRAEVERAAEEQTRLVAELDEARTAVFDAQQRLAEVMAEQAMLERALPNLTEALDAWRDLQVRRDEIVGRRQEVEVRVAGVAERRRVLAERNAEVERRLAGHAEERASAAARRERLEAEGTALRRLEAVVVDEHARLDAIFGELRHDYQDQVDAVRAGGERLEQLRQDRHTTEQRLDAVRNRTRALDLEANEVDLRTESLREHIARDLGARPEELIGLPEPEAPENTTLPQHAEELERKLTALGPVNPLALEELSQLEERHKELEAQVDDVRGARRELHEVVRTLDHEIMTSFAAAAADVNEHFSVLIGMLFPGGTGRLSLVDPDDLLNTGVEIEVRPAGRNVRRISLLSGGERSMAALAFLFAVFRSRPSPFYMMDEVEAALDDVNLSRFLTLVHEFRDEAQLLIVSHQKRTMETGDALYGVTMAPGGSSQVVSQKVEKDKETASA